LVLVHLKENRRMPDRAAACPAQASIRQPHSWGTRIVLAGWILIGVAVTSVAWALVGAPVGLAQSAPACNNQGLPNPCFFTPPIDTGNPLGSLKGVALKAQDPQLAPGGAFIANQTTLVQLGKAFFWDQQAGSDGQACASCHFSAGADPRTRNAISPGLKATPVDHTFELGGYTAPNSTLAVTEFPIHKLANIDQRTSAVLRDSNDVVGSSGVFFRTFTAVPDFLVPFLATRGADTTDICVSKPDPDGFQVGGVNVRRVEPRNTPTMINAAFNNRNFWDARAQDIFNGSNPFGARDPSALVYQSNGLLSSPTAVKVRITFASLASQAVGPPTSNFEMSCDGRTLPDIGHKLLQLDPLGQQAVDPNDSVLGPIANSRVPLAGSNGLTRTYGDLISDAFNAQWWDSTFGVSISGKPYSQKEANFSLFWGLAVKAYMETLTADNTPVDQFFDGNRAALSAEQVRGLNIFQSFQGHAPDPTNPTPPKTIAVTLSTGQPADARCITCHGGPEMTNASITNVQGQRLERMALRSGRCAIYDQGLINTGVRPSVDDPAVAGLDPFNNSFAETFLAQTGRLSALVPGVPQNTAPYGLNVTADPTVTGPALGGTTNCESNNITAAFKVPQLRNAELTGPYMHNGGQLTLMQVVDFYNRGGDFDTSDIDDNIHALGMAETDKHDLVSFLVALTDERVAFERAPFDHPSLCVANGEQGNSVQVTVGEPLRGGGTQSIAADQGICVSAVGASGRSARLTPFGGVSPNQH
jgi:cytochrome c peroxidase